MCFRSGEEDEKIPVSVADSCGHITPKPGSDLEHGTVAGERLFNL